MEKISININQLKSLHGVEITSQTLAGVQTLIAGKEPQVEAIIKSFILKENLSPFLQAGFISNLNAFPGRDTELMLSKFLLDPAPVVRANAARALMQVGSPQILAELEKQSGANEQLAFVHTVISHRFGIRATRMNVPPAEQLISASGATAGIASQPLSGELVQQVFSTQGPGDFQLGAYSQSGVKMNCPGTPTALLLQATTAASGMSKLLGSQPAVLATIFTQSEENKNWSFSRMVLGGPLEANRFYTGVFRRDGKLVLFGTGTQGEEKVSLNAIGEPGNVPMTVSVSWANGGLSLKGAASTKRIPPNRPVAVNR